MSRSPVRFYSLAFLFVPVLHAVSAGPASPQGLPQASPSAKACAWLPISALEAHFGTKAQRLAGIDQTTRNTCGASFPDPIHAAVIESHPLSAVDAAMTAAQASISSRVLSKRQSPGTMARWAVFAIS
jgi:hypothetical protein